MGNSLRCCLACVLPCGALDVIRIVHLNGHVEELTGPISAGEVLKANPNHVLSKPCSQGVVRRILILSPESDLKRGSIYFLIPSASILEKKRNSNNRKKSSKNAKSNINTTTTTTTQTTSAEVSNSDHCLAKVLSEKKPSSRRDRHSGVWKPHLESIYEDL
ncbi:6,7-dimethyl-8-ribityllumazine synthase [Thalictrum thalictroides]|uniref:6,7-dimethyl-8-ribityllumazine synthase n=1 Tax=Thalictrum thalictroides TaxID=46969 RepID=A0A7J6VD20_THATH|nr:6,7-dimethyl-8-ribityllumazine synthase [Thalictrum thalictroides]